MIHFGVPPSPLPISNYSAFCLICVGWGYCDQVSQNIKFFALILRKRRHEWGGPKYCIFSLSLALASFPSNAHVYQCHWQWCRELNANSKIPLWAQHCTNAADSKLGHCWAQSQPLGETQEAGDSVGRQWPQRFFWGWRYTLKHLQSQDGGLVAKSRPTLATPWTLARQALLSMELSRQAHWSGVPSPPPGDLPHPGIEPGSPALQADSLPTELQGKATESGKKSW